MERGNVVGGRPSVGSGGRFEQDMGKGGRPGRSKGSSPLTPLEKCSKAMSRVLRHEAGTDTCPISEEGWVKWDDLIRHPKMQPFNSWMARQALEENDKDRFVARPDAEGVWWIAAWSGHTLDGVVGPSVQVEQGLLVHGSHRKHSGSIQRQGILKGRRDIHLHDPDEHSEKWRKDIQTKIVVDTLKASQLGCLFRRTGNQVWLCDRDIPKEAIVDILPWDGLEVGANQRMPGLHHGTGSWAPKNGPTQPTLLSEEVVQVARDLADRVPARAIAIKVERDGGAVSRLALLRGPRTVPLPELTASAIGLAAQIPWSGSKPFLPPGHLPPRVQPRWKFAGRTMPPRQKSKRKFLRYDTQKSQQSTLPLRSPNLKGQQRIKRPLLKRRPESGPRSSSAVLTCTFSVPSLTQMLPTGSRFNRQSTKPKGQGM